VFPLLMKSFDFDEQAKLVWQFMCSIPVNLMEKFLPWLASSLSQEEQHVMLACMRRIVPKEELLQQVTILQYFYMKIDHGGMSCIWVDQLTY
jgi:zinc finger-like protein